MIVFISCVKTKRRTAPGQTVRARDLYTSQLFRKSLAYAESLHPDCIVILSARYGALDLDDQVQYYNATLKDMSRRERERWAEMVLKQLDSKHIDRHQRAVFLCGKPYREFVMPHFPNAIAPLEGISFGNQLKFYDRELRR